MLDILRPIFTGQKASNISGLTRVDVPEDLKASSLATNEFLDADLTLPTQQSLYYSRCKPRESS